MPRWSPAADAVCGERRPPAPVRCGMREAALHRRITLAIEFTKPDLLLRERIWRAMAPPKLTVASDVEYIALARKYELPGGFIKNAWLTALSIAIARDGSKPTVTQVSCRKERTGVERGGRSGARRAQ